MLPQVSWCNMIGTVVLSHDMYQCVTRHVTECRNVTKNIFVCRDDSVTQSDSLAYYTLFRTRQEEEGGGGGGVKGKGGRGKGGRGNRRLEISLSLMLFSMH